MISTLFNSVFGIKGLLIAVAVAFVLGFAGGFALEHKLASGDAARQEVLNLKKQLKARDEAAISDSKQFDKDRDDLKALKDKQRDAENKTGDGKCLDPSDVDGLRNLWK